MPTSEELRLGRRIDRLATDIEAVYTLVASLRIRLEALEDALQVRQEANRAHDIPIRPANPTPARPPRH